MSSSSGSSGSAGSAESAGAGAGPAGAAGAAAAASSAAEPTPIIYVRVRPLLRVPEFWIARAPDTLPTSRILGFPRAPPPRFERRQDQRPLLPASTTARVIWIQRSLAFPDAPFRMAADILNQGIWALASEFDAPASAGIAAVAGLAIARASCELLQELLQEIIRALHAALPASAISPRICFAAYHGTSLSNLETIERDGIAESSDGMLGRGIYLSHFWKATQRYALRDADYRPRAEGGLVLRCYVMVPGVIDRAKDYPPCPCLRCSTNPIAARIADHTAVWRTLGDAVHVASNPDDSVRGGITNEEWCVSKKVIFIQSKHIPDEATAHNLPGGAYNPGDRRVTIL